MEIGQIKAGQRVSQTAHPEYGTWFIKEVARAGGEYIPGMWHVHKCARASDGIVVDQAELITFWQTAQ